MLLKLLANDRIRHYDEIPRIDPLWLKPTAQSQQARIYRREVGLD